MAVRTKDPAQLRRAILPAHSVPRRPAAGVPQAPRIAAAVAGGPGCAPGPFADTGRQIAGEKNETPKFSRIILSPGGALRHPNGCNPVPRS